MDLGTWIDTQICIGKVSDLGREMCQQTWRRAVAMHRMHRTNKANPPLRTPPTHTKNMPHTLVWTGTISSLNLPEAWAADASLWLRTENSSYRGGGSQSARSSRNKQQGLKTGANAHGAAGVSLIILWLGVLRPQVTGLGRQGHSEVSQRGHDTGL